MNHLAAKELCSIAQELVSSRQVLSGLMEPPPAMVDEIYRWADANFAVNDFLSLRELITHSDLMIKWDEDSLTEAVAGGDAKKIEEARTALERTQLGRTNSVEQLKIHRSRALAYQGIKTKKWSKVAKSFTMDMAGWRYENVFNKAENQKLAWDTYGVITVVLSEAIGNESGSWNHLTKSLVIKNTLRDDLKLRDTISHEVSHWANSFMNAALGIEDFGRPSKNIRTPEVNQNVRKEHKVLWQRLEDKGIDQEAFHALDDSEFYTDLGTAITKFNIWHSKNDGTSLRDDFYLFTGRNGTPSSDFFRLLKKVSSGKWKKAVKEFAKAIGL